LKHTPAPDISGENGCVALQTYVKLRCSYHAV
jgi:hypothetical protein